MAAYPPHACDTPAEAAENVAYGTATSQSSHVWGGWTRGPAGGALVAAQHDAGQAKGMAVHMPPTSRSSGCDANLGGLGSSTAVLQQPVPARVIQLKMGPLRVPSFKLNSSQQVWSRRPEAQPLSRRIVLQLDNFSKTEEAC